MAAADKSMIPSLPSPDIYDRIIEVSDLCEWCFFHNPEPYLKTNIVQIIHFALTDMAGYQVELGSIEAVLLREERLEFDQASAEPAVITSSSSSSSDSSSSSADSSSFTSSTSSAKAEFCGDEWELDLLQPDRVEKAAAAGWRLPSFRFPALVDTGSSEVSTVLFDFEDLELPSIL